MPAVDYNGREVMSMIAPLGLAEDLEQAGFPRDQAHGWARARRDRSAEDLAAKSDLRWLELRLEARLSRIEQKIADARVAWSNGLPAS
jgi:hypothetical protein